MHSGATNSIGGWGYVLPHPPLAECYLFLGACATLGLALIVKVFATGYLGLVHRVTCAVVTLRESECDTG